MHHRVVSQEGDYCTCIYMLTPCTYGTYSYMYIHTCIEWCSSNCYKTSVVYGGNKNTTCYGRTDLEVVVCMSYPILSYVVGLFEHYNQIRCCFQAATTLQRRTKQHHFITPKPSILPSFNTSSVSFFFCCSLLVAMHPDVQ